MEEQVIIDRLKKTEADLKILSAYRIDPANSQADRNAVAFAILWEQIAYSAWLELVPDYVPPKDIQLQIAQAFGGTRGHISIVDGKVLIHSSLREEMQKAADIKANQKKETANG